MTFDTSLFIIFFVVIVGLYHTMSWSWRTKKVLLLLASYVFYMAWDPGFVVLIWLSTVVDHVVARRMARAPRAQRSRWLWLSLGTNLGLLSYFKYWEFFTSNLSTMLTSVGVTWNPGEWSIILPVGISFYTFQTLSYTIDVYREKIDPEEVGGLDFALFVAFFPQLVAGPIVRAIDFLPQLTTPRKANASQMGWGAALLIVGLFFKMVLGDTFLGPVANLAYNAAQDASLTMFHAWIGTLAFAGQIYFDFAGYSTCAIGAALCFGFKLPDNFQSPYGALGFSDFWRRWHMSLSTWLRDYLYISLGGNRHGPLRTYVNLSLTMLLGGLWHGASWNFVVWGALHGMYLVVERLGRRMWEGKTWAQSIPALCVGWSVTFVAVCFAWIFFRAETLPEALSITGSMLGFDGATRPLSASNIVSVLAVCVPMCAIQVAMRRRRLASLVQKAPFWLISLALTAMIILIYMSPSKSNAFIYFQF